MRVVLAPQSCLRSRSPFHFTRLPEWVSDQRIDNQPTGLWPDYWPHCWSEWFVSVLPDTYGALLLVLLTKWFYEQGSGESHGSRKS